MRLLDAARLVRRIARKPPTYLVERIQREAWCELDRWLAPRRAAGLGRARLLSLARAGSIDELWTRLRQRPFPAVTTAVDAAALDALDPRESARIIVAAERAHLRVVDLLGTGPIALGPRIDWSRDYRVNLTFPSGFCRSINYVNRNDASDVKVPWEISRLQWLIPVGQAWLLDRSERHAELVHDILLDWIEQNPVAYTVNWSCTMEAAMRLVVLAWLFHVFADSRAWRDEAFRVKLLACIYIHGDFTDRHIEKADVNGNHYTADLAGLVVAGHFFGDVGDAPRWLATGWTGLQAEIVKQVFPDGIDFEASCPYHRLVAELFLWPALIQQAGGKAIPDAYADRLRAMATFTAAYSRDDGSSPLWGDADDARTLPFGGQKLGDHRYLVGAVAALLNDASLAAQFSGPTSELAWMFGIDAARNCRPGSPVHPPSMAFPDGGVYIMRHDQTHVFIDCGPLGLAGRGGHGHNDALSFEASIDGCPLITDRGSYVYTASFDSRNEFRATASHNTPIVDHSEINRFDPNNLWSISNDAKAECIAWTPGEAVDQFRGRHVGYQRLSVGVEREITLDKTTASLTIVDRLTSENAHELTIPLHLAPDVSVVRDSASFLLCSNNRDFSLTWEGNGFDVAVEPSTISPSYGVVVPSEKLIWRRAGALPATLTVRIVPAKATARR